LIKLLENVFESDQRFGDDFVEMANALISSNKKALGWCDKLQKALEGNTISSTTPEEIAELKINICNECLEFVNILTVISLYFPDNALEGLRASNIFIYAANLFTVFKGPARAWFKGDRKL